jgi:hypothetical protein
LVCSKTPFEQSLATIQALLKAASSDTVAASPNLLEIAQAVLQDLHLASSLESATSSHHYALDVSTWAGFRFVYRAI